MFKSKNTTVFFVLVVFYTGCYKAAQFTNNREVNMMTDSFCNIDPGDHTPNECTPKISEDFIGIKINGPNEIILPSSVVSETINEGVIIPLCGIYRFSFSYDAKLGSPKEHMSIIVENNMNHHSYSGRMISPDPVIEDPNLLQIDM